MALVTESDVSEREQLAAAERAEAAGDYLAAESAFVAVAASHDSALAAEAQFHLGRVRWRQARYSAAITAFEIARTLGKRLGDRELLSRIENGMGAVHYARGDYAEARRAYAAAGALTSDRAMQGKLLLNLGVIENIEGNLPRAREHYDRALLLFQACRDTTSTVLALHNRGMIEADLESWEDAERSFSEALALASALGQVEMIARTLVNRSEVLVRRGANADAIADCERAMRTFSQLGDEVGRGEALRWHADALARDGQLQAADRSAREAIQIAARSEVRLLEAEAARELAVIRGLMGDAAGWQKALERSLALFRELGAQQEIAALERERAAGAPQVDGGGHQLPTTP